MARPGFAQSPYDGTLVSFERGLDAWTPAEAPLPPPYRRRGKAFTVIVNVFAVTPADFTCYHYDVKIGPSDEKRPARLNRQVWRHLVATTNPFRGVAVAYDGKAMAYSPARLPGDQGTWEINLPEADGTTSKRGNRFSVTITFARPIQLGALRAFIGGSRNVPDAAIMSAVQALNIAIQHGPMMVNPARGASFFLREGSDQPQLSMGLEMWRGFYSSLRPGIGKAFVNVDITSQVMYRPGTLSSLLVEIGRSKQPNFSDRDLAVATMHPRAGIEMNRLVKGLRISLMVADQHGVHPKRKIRELTRTSAATSTFQVEDGTTTNVAEWFRAHYNVTIRHPEWPCVRVSKVALYPVELCNVDMGQKYTRKLDPVQTSELLRYTTVKPQQRLAMLRRGIDAIRPRNDQAFGQWKLEISTAPMEGTARLLPAPTITYQRPLQPRDGTWDLRGQKFVKSSRIDRWMVLVFDREQYFPRSQVQQSITGLVQGLTSLGVAVPKAPPTITYVPQPMAPQNIDAFIRQTVGKQGGPPPQLLVCYLPRKPSPEYGAIKRFGDVATGAATQCLNIPKAKKGNPQYYANIALKINVKLGGQNSHATLGDTASPTIIFGADVSHPAPGSINPSIAAVVASMNKEITDYGSTIRVQASRQEVIEELDEMVFEMLGLFKTKVKVKPERLIFFRDGVSEGQFPQVLAHEVTAIRKACRKISADFQPAITFIVCGKRHHISIFPKNVNDGDRTGNVKAGTIIDTSIANPFTFDWYCQSHASLLGTSRSAHYTVLTDDSHFSADVLQQLVYNLTYTYARCSRSVSYATPAYYADRLCTRAALLLNAEADDSASSVSGAEADRQAGQLLADYRNRLQGIHPTQAQRLFFL
ncbi:hypothetical protein JCM1840_003135 [Sporobolomyces johnsonii]